MKKGLLILIFLGLTLPLLAPAATDIVITNPITATSFGEIVDNILTFIWWVALALVPLMIVIAGFYFVTAAGDPAKVEKAKGIILYAVIGFIIILLARGFVELLQNIL
jgi:hypothetical protein